MRSPPASFRPAQRGAALLIMLTVIVIGVAALFASALTKANRHIERDKLTTASFARAKDALIGWSLMRGAAAPGRPGELPCPDTDLPGDDDYGFAQLDCGPNAIGRLPWRTLGIEEPFDASGEPLWYALDDDFRTQEAGNSAPINNDTDATLHVFRADGSTFLTPENGAAAVIFAPGVALAGQVRNTRAQRRNAANYLDRATPPLVAVARNNDVGRNFIQGPVTDTAGTPVVNDRLFFITAPDLIARVTPLLP